MAGPKPERNAALLARYAVTGNLAETAREFGLTRERARQIVARAGDAAEPDGRARYPVEFKKAIAALAVREGVKPTAKISGIGVSNLYVWIGEFFGSPAIRRGRPPLDVVGGRDMRIRAALIALQVREAA
jgi:hypothetical protein